MYKYEKILKEKRKKIDELDHYIQKNELATFVFKSMIKELK